MRSVTQIGQIESIYVAFRRTLVVSVRAVVLAITGQDLRVSVDVVDVIILQTNTCECRVTSLRTNARTPRGRRYTQFMDR